MPWTGRSGSASTGMPGGAVWEVVGEDGQVAGGLGDRLVVGAGVVVAGRAEGQDGVGAGLAGVAGQAAACLVDGPPVPAITGTPAGTARRVSVSRAIRSPAVRAAASPVDPATATARIPRPASWRRSPRSP